MENENEKKIENIEELEQPIEESLSLWGRIKDNTKSAKNKINDTKDKLVQSKAGVIIKKFANKVQTVVTDVIDEAKDSLEERKLKKAIREKFNKDNKQFILKKADGTTLKVAAKQDHDNNFLYVLGNGFGIDKHAQFIDSYDYILKVKYIIDNQPIEIEMGEITHIVMTSRIQYDVMDDAISKAQAQQVINNITTTINNSGEMKDIAITNNIEISNQILQLEKLIEGNKSAKKMFDDFKIKIANKEKDKKFFEKFINVLGVATQAGLLALEILKATSLLA